VFAQTLEKAPSLQLTDIEGKAVRLDDYRGKVVLVNFWATWCPPCRKEIPDLIKWQRQYRSRGLQVVGIACPPETPAAVRDFARRKRVNYPLALGTKETKLLFTKSEVLPATVVIDSKGNVRAVIEGIVFPEEFDQEIKSLLPRHPRNQKIKNGSKRTATRLQGTTIIVDAEGYRPANIRLHRGIPARLTFIRKVADTCGTEIVIPSYGINRPLPLNVPVAVSFTPNRSGRFKLTCGMDMFRGSLIVR
jgi:cytochrome c biogenesis protein CcmG/thiol:disulfide interchange protein DsbE